VSPSAELDIKKDLSKKAASKTNQGCEMTKESTHNLGFIFV
jgi:hypothetical protein